MKRYITLAVLLLLAVSCGGRRGQKGDGAQADSLATAAPEKPDTKAEAQVDVKPDTSGASKVKLPKEPIFDIVTNMGTIRVKLYKDTPKHRDNFARLALSHYYDGVLFHRVIDEFMIQGGDPDGTGRGGPGYTIEDEFGHGHSNVRGTIAMANTGRPNTGGSQFFINVVDNVYLDKEYVQTPYAHPVFGTVISGMDVADAISKVKTDRNDKPLKDVVIERMEVVED